MAMVYASRARLLGNDLRREERAKGSQLLRVGELFAASAAIADGRIVPRRIDRQNARALHAAASRNAALAGGRRDNLCGGAAGRSAYDRETLNRSSSTIGYASEERRVGKE